jgi:hypothetical protein
MGDNMDEDKLEPIEKAPIKRADEVRKERNIYEKIMLVRYKFLKKNKKPTGKMKVDYKSGSSFTTTYYSLDDIVPTMNELCCEYKLYYEFGIEEGIAKLRVLDIEKGDTNNSTESRLEEPTAPEVEFKVDMKEMLDKNALNVKDAQATMQNIGRMITFMKRYMYGIFLDICEQTGG